MKRPGSVIAAIVVLSLMVAINIYTVVMTLKDHPDPRVLAVGVLPAIHIATLFSLLGRKFWARWLSAIVLSLWGIFFIVAGFISALPQHKIAGVVGMAIPGTLLLWLAYSLVFGDSAKRYFHPSLPPPLPGKG